jgi:hypothetical protein
MLANLIWDCSVVAALPPHTAESLRLSGGPLIHFCGEAEPRRNLKH